jgi:hypothetical protein
MATVIIAAVAAMPRQDRAGSRWCTTRPASIAADGERDQYQQIRFPKARPLARDGHAIRPQSTPGGTR